MKTLSVFAFFMIVSFFTGQAHADHQIITIETDVLGPTAAHKRIGFDVEVWPVPWFAVGAGREADLGISTRDHEQSSLTSQALSLRFQFSGFFLRLSTLERQHTIQRKDSSTPVGTENEPARTVALTGNRTAIGYWLEFGILLLSVGYFQESLSTETLTFNDDTEKEVGGDFGAPFLMVGLAF